MTRHPPLTGPVFALVVCLGLPAAALAQRVTASVDGTVKDEAGGELPGATVTARNVETGLTREATTGTDGRYVIVSLPVEGTYELLAAGPGFASVAREGVDLVPDQTVTVDFVLRLAAQATVVVGVGQEPSVDREHAAVRQIINEPLVRELPLFGRGFMPLVSLAAGFTGSPDFPNPQGQAYSTNNVLVDGASHFSKWRSAPRSFYSGYGLESVKQVQVLTNLFSAEFGEALASVTSVTTKAGTNVFHGSGLLFVRDDALDAVPAFASRKPPSGAQQFGASLGGPLELNRTHFFVSYEGRRVRDHNIVVSPVALGAEAPDDQDEHLLFLRVDRQHSNRQVVTARYNGQRFRWNNEPGGLTLPGTGTHYRTDVHTFLATDALQFSNRSLGEARLQYARFTDLREDLNSGVYVNRAGYSIEGGLLGSTGFGAAPENTWEGAYTFSFYFPSHTLRSGAGVKAVRAHVRAFTYGRGAYYFAGPPSTSPRPYLFVQSLAPSPEALEGDPRSSSMFAFVQDDWRLNERVSLNLGLRYDVDAISNVAGVDVPTDRNNVQPRVGVAWDLRGNGRTVIRSGFGFYMQQHLLYPISRLQLEGPPGAAVVTVADGSPLMPVFPGLLPSTATSSIARDTHRLGARFRNPHAIQGAVGVQREMFGGVVSADGVWLRGRNLTSLVDANAPASIQKPAQRTVAAADATRPAFPAPGTFRKVITLGNEGRSWYRALQVKFDRSVGAVQALGSYTLSRADEMASYQLPEDSRDIAAEKARASADVRHNMAAGLTWVLPGRGPLMGGWSLSGIAVVRSNRPYTISWGDDRNGTTQNDARPGDRNTGKTGRYRTIDLALNRHQRRGRADIEVRIEAYNLIDAVNYDQYVGELLSPFFAQPISAFPPRRLQLAVVTRF